MREPSPGHWRVSNKRPQIIGPLTGNARPNAGRVDAGTMTVKSARKGEGTGTPRSNGRKCGRKIRRPR